MNEKSETAITTSRVRESVCLIIYYIHILYHAYIYTIIYNGLSFPVLAECDVRYAANFFFEEKKHCFAMKVLRARKKKEKKTFYPDAKKLIRRKHAKKIV